MRSQDCIFLSLHCYSSGGLPWRLRGEQSTFNAGDISSIPGLGRSPGGRHDSPLQYSCLENPMDRGAWWATVQELQNFGGEGERKGFRLCFAPKGLLGTVDPRFLDTFSHLASKTP